MYIDEKIYNKLEDIILYESKQKEKTLERIQKLIDDVNNNDNNDYSELYLQEVVGGYMLKGKHHFICIAIFCYTLTEVIIHLRYLRQYSK